MRRPLLLGALLFDILAVVAAWGLAYALRFEFHIPADSRQSGLLVLVVLIPVYGATFLAFGLYRGMWRFASLPDLLRILRAVVTGSAAMLAITIVLAVQPAVPRTVLFLMPLFLLCIMGGARATYRSINEFHQFRGLIAMGKPVLVVGAGQTAASLIRELARSPEWMLVGLLDDDPAKIGRELHGYDILGSTLELPHWAKHYDVAHVIVAMPTAPLEVQKRIFEICIQNRITAMVIPELTSLDEGKPFLSRIRNIDLEDLLGREAVKIDTPHVRELLHNQVVLVTGAGGSIGSELCRQIAPFGPAMLIAVELSEFALYQLTEEFSNTRPEIELVPFAGDVKDPAFLDYVLSRYTPSIVFHAAAYKHVPLMEHNNAWQAIRNNVLGTYHLARAAMQYRVTRFVLVSTDKAVNPTNVMGASKRLAEMLCQTLQRDSQHTAFVTVRFGNVLGSDGSVVPKFQEQIARGGPVTVTHPDITRYFMTIPEASLLVLQASSMGRGGEIFMLDMGRPVKIVDLARDLIRLHGFRDGQIDIVFTGLRPGEKLHEELLAEDETAQPTPHAKLRIARARDVDEAWIDAILPWMTQRRCLGDDEVRRDLRRWVPEYAPLAPTPLQAVPARAHDARHDSANHPNP